ncbi:hypothetical protein NO1_1342 [Candidatus Termititenax aidoneus]|uniref:Uncharacterized protein n=1 Tax=Termititenax aidoneus TaxID=2218524 RepID=A0A388TCA9_TERA1|nr:hypothetical protein NO1_1342 [Candidatus Termititenax aidoneus]
MLLPEFFCGAKKFWPQIAYGDLRRVFNKRRGREVKREPQGREASEVTSFFTRKNLASSRAAARDKFLTSLQSAFSLKIGLTKQVRRKVVFSG